jgi:hypothetical protein
MDALISQLDLQDDDDDDPLQGIGMRDETSMPASALRFSVGNVVIYKTEHTKGWYEGEIVKVNQRVKLSRTDNGIYIAYVMWPYREMSDEELGTEWVFQDTDEFIRPRTEDLTPDPAKFKPLFVAPEDPHYYLYTNTERFDSKTEEGTDMADVFRGLAGVDHAKTNPDGSIKISRNGRKVTTMCQEIPQEGGPIIGVEPYVAMMFSGNQLSLRERVGTSPMMNNMIELFKMVDPGTSLAQLEVAAKTSSSKMLQLADCLMVGLHGWPRDYKRACNLYRASAWGCSEEDEHIVEFDSVPVGDPKAMIAVASLNMIQLKSLCGYHLEDNCPFWEWIGEGLRNAKNMSILYQIFLWVTHAMRYHGHVTSLTLMIGRTIQEMNFTNDRHLVGEIGQGLKDMSRKILQAYKYREKELQIMDMHEKGSLPRGDPTDEVVQMFKPHALTIFQNLPQVDDTIHIEFKQISRPPFPMIVISFLPSKRKFVKIVRLSKSLQLTPFSLESFEHVWLRIAFDIHLGRLGSNERCRPKAFTVLNDGHGNSAFASYLKNLLESCNTEVRLVAHSDVIKTGKRSRSTLGDLVSEMTSRLHDVPGFVNDDDSQDDIVARAQEDHVDHLVSQQIVTDGEDNADESHLLEAERMKQRGNEHFQARDFSSANR